MKQFEEEKHSRRSIRLQGYDYTREGGYFITLVTFRRESLFGEISGEEMNLSTLGEIARECWEALPRHFPRLRLDAFVIMPNHVHGILFLEDIDHPGVINHRWGANKSSWGTKNKRWGTIYRAPTKEIPTESHQERFGKSVPGSIPTIIRTYKAAVTRRAGRELQSGNIWQRNYFEHILRDRDDYERIARYIQENPARWNEDDEIIPFLTNKDQ